MNFGSKNKLAKALLLAALSVASSFASATDREQKGLTLSNLRFVGDYQGSTFDNIVELWFTTNLVWAPGSNCTSGFRVMVDATKNKHLIAALLMAHATGRKININVDDTLPIRDGACEVTFVDVPMQ